MAIFLNKNQKLSCYSLGTNDFVYNEKINLYQASIDIPSLTKDTKVSVRLHNHTFSSKHICLEGKMLIVTTVKPSNSIQVKVIIESEGE